MNIFVRTPLFILLMATVLFSAPPKTFAQEEKERAERELSKVMAKQEPLNADDIRVYLSNVDPIFRLRFEPDKLEETILATGTWSKERFSYVTIKVAVGMGQIMRPDDTKYQDVGDFAKPTPQELDLIMEHKDELIRAMERVQARYATAPTPQAN